VLADAYPYTASSTSLRTLLPDWALEGGVEGMLGRLRDAGGRAHIREALTTANVGAPSHGPRGESMLRAGWENIMIVNTSARRDAEGRRLSEIASARKLEPVDALLDLLLDEGGRGSVILFQMDEADYRRALAHPAVMVGSDGSSIAPTGPLAANKPHPRNYGTFPRVLGEYTREQRVISLAHAVHKMTGLPARRLGLRDRGEIRVGARADLVVFDARRVTDLATYEDPHRYPAGIEQVLVSGRFVIKDGEHTGNLPGRVLRHL
jgi:N-acyl-D-aspartate/D-glutamate deacylase